MIELKNVSKSYGDKSVLSDFSLDVPAGCVCGIVGPNGAGKTTTMKILTGILKPNSGHAIVNGHDMALEPLLAKGSIGYISDSPDMFLRLKGIEFLNFIADIYKIPTDVRVTRISEFATRFGLESLLDSPMQNYSHGERQKIMVTAALVHNPPVWILDEPLIGLDPKSAFELKKMMREHADAGNAVLFSTHVLEVAQKLCDKIVVMNHGKQLYYGTLDELCTTYPGRDLEEIFLEITE